MSDMECICFTVSRRDWTFSNSISTVLVTLSELSYAVPMYACAIGLQLIVNVDLNIITPIYYQVSLL